jgi:ABC-type multidrug transport system fused ATPase/permease subunit
MSRGTKLGIAGESGSGKSTLINLLFRFFDPGLGRLQIDGVDLKELKLKDYRGLLALVSQDVVVFDQSVYDNIACGRIGASREDVMRAAEQAHATEFIEALVDGFDTRLGERGVTLSGGQRQRIAIVRAFVRNAPILVLDEATAALDAKSEAEVQSAIGELAANRTVICIAHRLSTLKSMDEVMVLDKGLIIEKGPYDSLLREGGAFAQMSAPSKGIRSV